MAQMSNPKPSNTEIQINKGPKSITIRPANNSRKPSLKKKMVSKILSDKLLLEDTMKNYKPLGKM